jgi:hypothetical protein
MAMKGGPFSGGGLLAPLSAVSGTAIFEVDFLPPALQGYGPLTPGRAEQAETRKTRMSGGVTVYNRDKCFNGYTLFCESYDYPKLKEKGEGIVYLIDMEGEPAHTWRVTTPLQSYCRLLPNGNLLYPTHDRSLIREAGLREIDPEGKVVWHYHCRTDHDFQILENGNLLIHTIHDFPWPELGRELKRHPWIIEIDREKNLLWRWRGEEHLGELEQLLPPEGWAHFQDRVTGKYSFDWAHNNTCQVIPDNATYRKELESGDKPRFEAGNIIFSYRSLDIIGVISRETGEIVWAWGPGILDGQHKPHMLPSGDILIFDNGTLRGYSRVIELNPLTEAVEWEYTAEPKEAFLSEYISGAQRLPNGNTLVCEGDRERLFEVTPEGETVWEFRNPYRDEFALGSIYRCLRYSAEYCKPLLDRR